MRITSGGRSPSAGAVSRKAAIEKQLRKLEQKRQKLVEKMQGQSEDSAKTKLPELSQGTISVNNAAINRSQPSQPAYRPATVAQPAAASANPAQKAAIDEVRGVNAYPEMAELQANAAATMSDSVATLQESYSALSGSLSSGGGGERGGSAADSLESISEQIEVVDMQILALRQQLAAEDEGTLPGAAAAVSADAGAEAVKSAVESNAVAKGAQAAEAALPVPTVDVEGHVDGYV